MATTTTAALAMPEQQEKPEHQRPEQPKAGILPSLPNITTTISQLLTGPAPQSEDRQTPSNDRLVASPLSAYFPSASWWGRRTSVKSLSKSAGNSPRTPKADMTLSSLNEIANHDAASKHSSDNDSQTTRKRKRSPRQKTCYTLCHAPPRTGTRSKIQVRARPLLQLHKLEEGSRPQPTYELLPSSIFSARLVKAIAKFSGSRCGLHPHDLAIVKAEKYHAHEDSQADVDESRDILAVICGIGRGSNASTNVRIIMEGGVEWEAYQLPTGSYECTTVDDHGLKRTVRWVPKRNKSGDFMSPLMSPLSPTSTSFPDLPGTAADKRFNFSTISAKTRRHPIIAHLTRTGLEVNDNYTLPAPSASTDFGAPRLDRSMSDESVESADEKIVTTEELRRLIAATSIYVALLEGWCVRFRGEDSLARSMSTRSASKSISPTKANRNSTPSTPVTGRPNSIDLEPIKRTSSLRQALRNPTSSFTRKLGLDKDGNRPSSTSSSLSMVDPPPGSGTMPGIPEADTPVASRRRRADTTSTVIMRPASPQESPLWPPSHADETDDEEDHRPEEEEEGVPNGDYTARPGSAGTFDGAPSEKSASSSKRRNLSGSTYGSFESKSERIAIAPEISREKDEVAAISEKKSVQLEKKEQKKKGFMSRLLCGMV